MRSEQASSIKYLLYRVSRARPRALESFTFRARAKKKAFQMLSCTRGQKPRGRILISQFKTPRLVIGQDLTGKV